MQRVLFKFKRELPSLEVPGCERISARRTIENKQYVGAQDAHFCGLGKPGGNVHRHWTSEVRKCT